MSWSISVHKCSKVAAIRQLGNFKPNASSQPDEVERFQKTLATLVDLAAGVPEPSDSSPSLPILTIYAGGHGPACTSLKFELEYVSVA